MRVSPALAANLTTNLRFYRRNRLLVAAALTLAALLALFTVPTAIHSTTGQRFRIVGDLLGTFQLFTVLVTGILGLIALPTHLRNRSYELVVTRPCRPETWLLSHFGSAVLVAGALSLLGFVLGWCLFLAFDIPFQWGLLYLVAHTFCKAMILFSYLTFLAAVLHPALAVLVAFLLQEGMIWRLLLWVSSGAGVVQDTPFRSLLLVLEPTLHLVYVVLPMYAPHGETAERIGRTFRVTEGDLGHLGLAALYTAVVGVLLYLLTTLALRRRPQAR